MTTKGKGITSVRNFHFVLALYWILMQSAYFITSVRARNWLGHKSYLNKYWRHLLKDEQLFNSTWTDLTYVNWVRMECYPLGWHSPSQMWWDRCTHNDEIETKTWRICYYFQAYFTELSFEYLINLSDLLYHVICDIRLMGIFFEDCLYLLEL